MEERLENFDKIEKGGPVTIGTLLDEIKEDLSVLTKKGLEAWDKFDELEKGIRRIGKRELHKEGESKE